MDTSSSLSIRRQRRRYVTPDLLQQLIAETTNSELVLPSRRARSKAANNQFYQEAVAGIVFFLIGLYALIADFSHVDRHWLPIVSVIAAAVYASFGIWGLIRLIKTITLPRISLGCGKVKLFGYDSSGALLINRPHLRGYFRLVLETGISLSVWVVFLYFFQPLLTALLWLLTGEWLWWFIFSSEAVYGTLSMLYYAVLFAGVIFLSFLAWAQWNLYHYGGLDRRKPPLPIEDEKVAEHFGVPLSTVQNAKMARVATINPTPEGPIFTIKSKNLTGSVKKGYIL
ncbi:MAG: poly-beta-1,6-N-acetyl-D-glucosamine biosynthesis protein PgaD [Pelosinus sp.]|nr:poly-beta-1,6-N-acetyl-D-glucosamine biosynthesis protein PgaD [Pelosinus sp.]